MELVTVASRFMSFAQVVTDFFYLLTGGKLRRVQVFPPGVCVINRLLGLYVLILNFYNTKGGEAVRRERAE